MTSVSISLSELRLCVTLCLVFVLVSTPFAFAMLDAGGGASWGYAEWLPYTARAKAAVPPSWRAAGIEAAAAVRVRKSAGKFLMASTPDSSDLLVVKDGSLYQVPLPMAPYSASPKAAAKIGHFLRD